MIISVPSEDRETGGGKTDEADYRVWRFQYMGTESGPENLIRKMSDGRGSCGAGFSISACC